MDAWFDDIPTLLIFERAARLELGSLQRRYAQKPRRLIYELDVDVPGYDSTRHVRIELPALAGARPRVLTDGPEDSAHRYQDGSLCMYYPHDPPERRWMLADGLAGLVDMIRTHLFQEEDARRGHGWSGDEVAHGLARAARSGRRR